MEKEKLVLFLNRLLANYFVIFIKCHRYVWFMKGEHIFLLQKVFYDLKEEIKSEIDQLAEHILSMDGKPFATMEKYVKEATIEEATADDLEEEMISQLTADFLQIQKEISEIGIHKANTLDDALTLHLLYSMQKKLNKYIWRFRNYDKK